MSEIRSSTLTGIIRGCTTFITTVSTAIATAEKDRRAYLRQQLGKTPSPQVIGSQRAVLERIGRCLVKVEREKAVARDVRILLAATTQDEVEEAARTLTATVHQEQQLVAQHLAPVVAQATAAAGFPSVQRLPGTDRLLVIGEDVKGMALQHEIVNTPGQPLTIRSETLGIPEGHCEKALDHFERALTSHGVSVDHRSRVRKARRSVSCRAKVRQ